MTLGEGPRGAAPGSLAELEWAVGAAEEVAASLPVLRAEAAAARLEASAARERRDAAGEAVGAASRAVLRTTLPALPAWGALLTGRYARRRDAAETAAEEALDVFEREQADAERAGRRAETAQARVEHAVRTATDLPRLREALAEARLVAAGDPRVRALRELDGRRFAVGDRLRELTEAQVAVASALSSVDEAVRRLDSAHAWGTYDTFFGGGLLSTMVKHDRIDDANEATARVRRALDRARKELADCEIRLVATDLGLDGGTRFVDAFFDNVFTDLRVQGRIEDQQALVGQLRRRLQEARRLLERRVADAEAERSELDRRRRELLGPA